MFFVMEAIRALLFPAKGMEKSLRFASYILYMQ